MPSWTALLTRSQSVSLPSIKMQLRKPGGPSTSQPFRRTRAALNLIFSDHFNREQPGLFEPLRSTLPTHGDYSMHLPDLTSYVEAEERLSKLYALPDEWARKAILNVASSGEFSGDRSIAEYAKNIRGVKACTAP
jgi:glycogen phosphorylase